MLLKLKKDIFFINNPIKKESNDKIINLQLKIKKAFIKNSQLKKCPDWKRKLLIEKIKQKINIYFKYFIFKLIIKGTVNIRKIKR